MAAPKKRAADPTTVTARLIQRVPAGTPGSTVVAGVSLLPQPLAGINGDSGWQAAHYERWLGVEGPWSMEFPNTRGPDGRLHVKRLLQRAAVSPQYGDEWIEIRRDGPPRLLYVGELRNIPSATLGKLPVGGYDAMWGLKLVRETEAGFWSHSPRDAMEHYTRVWNFDVATGFPEPGAAPVTTDGTLAAPITTGSLAYFACRTNTGLPVCRVTATPSAYVRAATTPPNIGYASADPYAPWRVEASIYVSAPLPSGAGSFTLGDQTADLGLQVYGTTGTTNGLGVRLLMGPASRYLDAAFPGLTQLIPGQIDLALEGRERWIYCYVNGQLVGVMPMPASNVAPATLAYNPGGGTAVLDVRSFTYERGLPWLMRGADKGDYVLPGAPTPGGLRTEYFDDADLHTLGNVRFDVALNPTRQPYASRMDATINFAAGAWEPPGPSGDWSMRSTGSIFLDLANFDYRVGLQATNGLARLWVGKTRFGEQPTGVSLWPPPAGYAPFGGSGNTGTLRAQLGMKSGWYPIRVEGYNYVTLPSFALNITLERSDLPDTFSPIPATILSPYGVYQNQVRRDSHYDTYRAIGDAFGYQFTLEPKSLESGLFPGQLIPRVRVGRDVNLKVRTGGTTDLGLTSTGEDMAARIVADAQGIADPTGSAQLSASVVNYATATGHMFCATQAESLSDITDARLLSQRLSTLLALRSGTWDRVASRPDGHPQLADSWPPATVPLPARFAFEPGDAVLRDYPAFGIVDTSPTQLASVAWDLTPHGVSAPVASYFVYPRGLLWTLRQHRKDAIAGKRNYQQQLAVYQGSFGGRTGTAVGSPATPATDLYSRLALPVNIGKVQRVVLSVTTKLDSAITWGLEVNGILTAISVRTATEYDISAFAGAYVVGLQPQMVARLIPPGAGTPYDTVEYFLTAQIVL